MHLLTIDIPFFCIIIFGAFVAQIFFMDKMKIDGVRDCLEHLFPDRQERFYYTLEFVLVPILSSIAVCIFLSPQTYITSFYDGITSVSVILSFKKNVTE